MVLLPGVLRRPTAAAVTQVFWLLQKKPRALHFITSVGEPKWCHLVPCDHHGKKLASGELIRVPSSWLNPGLCLAAELSAAERNKQLLSFLVSQRSAHNDSHALSVSSGVTLP